MSQSSESLDDRARHLARHYGPQVTGAFASWLSPDRSFTADVPEIVEVGKTLSGRLALLRAMAQDGEVSVANPDRVRAGALTTAPSSAAPPSDIARQQLVASLARDLGLTDG